MNSCFRRGICIAVVLLLLGLSAACAFQKNALSDGLALGSTTTSANQTDKITIDTRRAQTPRKSSRNLEEYMTVLSAVTDIETLAAYLETPANDLEKENFDMLFKDGFFLVPILPENCTFLYAAVLADGTSSFNIRLDNHCEIEVVCHHDKQAGYWFTYATSFAGEFKNSRGIAISRYTFEATGSGYYAWEEEGYKCIVNTVISPKGQATCEAFLKGLTFKKVYIDQSSNAAVTVE